jgi:hypothetical protein
MCRRLNEDDNNLSFGNGNSFIGLSRQKMFIGLIGIGGGYWLWMNRGRVLKLVSSVLRVKGKAIGGGGIHVSVLR